LIRKTKVRCPFCRKDHDKVVDTRPNEDGSVIRRRRECVACGKRFTTHERLEEVPLRVIKKTGERAPYSRENVLKGVTRALEKRPVSLDQVEGLVDDIEREIMDHNEREVSTAEIGRLVMSRLYNIDAVAYVRFASVYREFKAVDEFVREINTLEREKGK
jgi:transcriptional repressor NrdR